MNLTDTKRRGGIPFCISLTARFSDVTSSGSVIGYITYRIPDGISGGVIMPRQRQDETPADFCRRMGWGVGTMVRATVNIGVDYVAQHVVERTITAIGTENVLVETPITGEHTAEFHAHDW